MKCQIQFSGKNKKNIINLSSAENAQRVVKVKKRYLCSVSIKKDTLEKHRLSIYSCYLCRSTGNRSIYI